MKITYNTDIIKKMHVIKYNMKVTDNVATLVETLIMHRLENPINAKMDDDQKPTPLDQAAITLIAECGSETSTLEDLYMFSRDDLTNEVFSDIKVLADNDYHVPFMFIIESDEEFDENEFYTILFGIDEERPDYNFISCTFNMKTLKHEMLKQYPDMQEDEIMVMSPLFYRLLKNSIESAVPPNVITLRAYLENDNEENM